MIALATWSREMKTYPEGEKQEMVQIYKEKGFTDEDAKTVIDIMAKYNEFFVDLMMVQELNLQVPDPDDNPWKDGTGVAAAAHSHSLCCCW